MPIDLSRPTLTRDIPELTVGQQGGGMPSLGVQNVPTNVQGPNRFLAILSDVLAGVSNPRLMQQQQESRRQGIEDVFSRAQEAAGLRSRVAESTFQRQLAMQKMDEPEFRVDAKGNVTIINPRALREGSFSSGVIRIERAKQLDPQGFSGEIDRLGKMFNFQPTEEEKAQLFVAYQDAMDADDVTPFRQAFSQIMGRRASEARQEKSIAASEQRQLKSQEASEERQRRSFTQQIEMQNRSFQHQLSMTEIRERMAQMRQQNSPQHQKNVENAKSGLRALANIRKMLFEKDGITLSEQGKSLLMKAAIPGAIGAREFSAQRNEMIDVLTRLRTGAALNEDEQTFYEGQAPGALDITEPQAIITKLKMFEDLYSGIVGGTRTLAPQSPC